MGNQGGHGSFFQRNPFVWPQSYVARTGLSKKVAHFLITISLFFYFAYRDVEDASYASMEEDLELVELGLSERPRLGAP